MQAILPSLLFLQFRRMCTWSFTALAEDCRALHCQGAHLYRKKSNCGTSKGDWISGLRGAAGICKVSGLWVRGVRVS